jgi:hypothetical protein
MNWGWQGSNPRSKLFRAGDDRHEPGLGLNLGVSDKPLGAEDMK